MLKNNNHWKIIFCINLLLQTPKFQIHNFAAYQAQHSFLDLLSTSNNMKPILSSSYQFLLILLIFFEYFLYYIHISWNELQTDLSCQWIVSFTHLGDSPCYPQAENRQRLNTSDEQSVASQQTTRLVHPEGLSE